MKIMIFGDSGSGKSTFSKTLSKSLDIKHIHLDKVMQSIGRSRFSEIEREIIKLASKEKWILDGNAFNKDSEFRIKSADLIYFFDFNPFFCLFSYIQRCLRNKDTDNSSGNEPELNLSYIIPYIFFKFPIKKKAAFKTAKRYNKKIIIFTSRRQVNSYVKNELKNVAIED